MNAPAKCKRAVDYLAEQTDTNPDDWTHIPTGTTLYKQGYRWWNKVTNQFAKRVQTNEMAKG